MLFLLLIRNISQNIRNNNSCFLLKTLQKRMIIFFSCESTVKMIFARKCIPINNHYNYIPFLSLTTPYIVKGTWFIHFISTWKALISLIILTFKTINTRLSYFQWKYNILESLSYLWSLLYFLTAWHLLSFPNVIFPWVLAFPS